MPNSFPVTGNLTRDPELRVTPSGRQVCNFGIADSKSVKDQETGEYRDVYKNFWEVACWGDLAEHVYATYKDGKGKPISLNGTLKQRKYTNREGIEVTVSEIDAFDVAVPLRNAIAIVNRVRKNTDAGAAKSPSAPPADAPAPKPAAKAAAQPVAAPADDAGFDGDNEF